MKRRGVALMVALWLSLLLLVLGLALLNRRADQYRAAQRVADAAVAYELAVAGMETARVRLDKDAAFPPRGVYQTTFSCTEAVYDVDNTTVRGYYILDVDSRWANQPYYLLKVTSTGYFPNPNEPQARRRIHAELDINPAHGATYYRWVSWHDEGTL